MTAFVAVCAQLQATGHLVLPEEIARLSPFMRRHINVHGHYSFHPPDLVGARRALRYPDVPDELLPAGPETHPHVC